MNPTPASEPPADGTRVLVWYGGHNYGQWMIATYQAEGWLQHWYLGDQQYLVDDCVVCWMLLPPNPLA